MKASYIVLMLVSIVSFIGSLYSIYAFIDLGFVYIFLLIFVPPAILGGVFGGVLGQAGVNNFHTHGRLSKKGVSTKSPISWAAYLFWIVEGIILSGPNTLIIMSVWLLLGEYINIFSRLLAFFYMMSTAVFGLFGIIILSSGLMILLVAFVDGDRNRWLNDSRIRLMVNFVYGLGLVILSTVSVTVFIYHGYSNEILSTYDFHTRDPDWQLLPDPPVELTSLIAARPFEIYAQSKDEKILGCIKTSGLDESCWFEIETVPEATNLPCDRESKLPRFGGRKEEVVEITDVEYCGIVGREMKRSAFVFVLTESGQVWQWGDDDLDLVQTPRLDLITARFKQIAFFSGCIVGVIILVGVFSLFVALNYFQRS